MALKHRLGWDANFTARSAWFWPLSAAASQFAACADWPTRAALNTAYAELTAHAEVAPLVFAENVRREELHDGQDFVLEKLYDGRITRLGEVPTRERDWHDFFNALCFMTFPRAKRVLHRRQYGLLSRRITPGSSRLPSTRTSEQDALTLFDEGGAVIAAEADAYQQLVAADDATRYDVLARARDAGQARVIPFGHALFEHLVEGLRCPGGSTRVVCVPDASVPDRELVAVVDALVAASLEDPGQFLEPRESAHLRLDTLGLR